MLRCSDALLSGSEASLKTFQNLAIIFKKVFFYGGSYAFDHLAKRAVFSSVNEAQKKGQTYEHSFV
jgi:hypothetical protein